MWVKLIAQKRRAPRPTKMRVEASMRKRFLRGRKPKIKAPQRAKNACRGTRPGYKRIF